MLKLWHRTISIEQKRKSIESIKKGMRTDLNAYEYLTEQLKFKI